MSRFLCPSRSRLRERTTGYAGRPPDTLVQNLVEALEARIRAATTAGELQAISPAVIEAADLFRGRHRAGLAEALVDGFVALNHGEPDQIAWLVEHLTAHNTRERLVVRLIERGLSLGPTLDAVSWTRAHSDSVQVFETLVQRARQAHSR
jgi:hypothetical protein